MRNRSTLKPSNGPADNPRRTARSLRGEGTVAGRASGCNGAGFIGLLASDGLNGARKLAYDELLKLNFRARVVDVNSDEVAPRIVIQDHACRNLATFDARLFG